jgi:hypothetical protein
MIFLKICLIIIIIINVLILAKLWIGKIPVVINNYSTSIIASRVSEEKFTSIVKWTLISAYIFKIIILLTTVFVL